MNWRNCASLFLIRQEKSSLWSILLRHLSGSICPARCARRLSVHVLASKREILHDEITFSQVHRRTRVAPLGTTKIRMLRGFRSLRKSSERKRGRSHLLKHFSNASTSWVREQHLYIRYSPRRGIPSSNPRQVSMFFVFAFLCSTLRLCAHV